MLSHSCLKYLRFSTVGESTSPIPSDADASTFKAALQALTTIENIDVSRSDVDSVGGYVWTISFLEDAMRTHEGDMPAFGVSSSLTAGSGKFPSISTTEVRKGTQKEVQSISISAGGDLVDPESSFMLSFGGMHTGEIMALPAGGATCLGSTAARQIITTGTEDTTEVGGDDTVSPLTNFTISYKGFSTSFIEANSGSCIETATIIANELMFLPPLKTVVVTGSESGSSNDGCIWVVTLLSVTGNPELFQGEITMCSPPTLFY